VYDLDVASLVGLTLRSAFALITERGMSHLASGSRKPRRLQVTHPATGGETYSPPPLHVDEPPQAIGAVLWTSDLDMDDFCVRKSLCLQHIFLIFKVLRRNCVSAWYTGRQARKFSQEN
jgi:hypothetical protein